MDTDATTKNDKDQDVSLVLLGYSLKDITSERRTALEAASRRGVEPTNLSILSIRIWNM